jgi:RNA polymerase sigma-70 factor (ECF subfamily)
MSEQTTAGWIHRPAWSHAKIANATNSLTAAEQTALINSLTAAEQTALMKIAKHYAKAAFGLHHAKEFASLLKEATENLVNDAICRVLDGRRAWPREVPSTVFLGGVIGSIAWEWKSDLPNQEIDTGDEGAGARGTLAKIDVMKIIALFDDDPVAQKIVMAMMDGARGEELEQLSGLNLTEYESKRKKIRRRIEKLEAESDE